MSTEGKVLEEKEIGGTASHNENVSDRTSPTPGVAAAPVTPRRRTRSGCLGCTRKYWWLHLIVFVVILLVVLLPIIFVLVPKIIRDDVNKSTLTVQGIHVTNTRTKTAEIAINSTITTSSSRSATIEAFNASLYLTDKLPHTPFVTIEMPEVHSSKVSTLNTTQNVTITDEQAFADYNSWYLLNESFSVTVDGWTHVKVSGLPSVKVHFLKTVNLTGLNAFAGLNLTSSNVSLVPDAQGDNFHGTITIPNPSVLTVDIGNTSFVNTLLNTTIGMAFIDALFLVPGDNNLSIRAAINETPVLDTVLSQPYCNTGILPLTFVGQNITNFGQELPYFEQGFRANVLELDLNVAVDLEALGFPVACPSNSSTKV